MGTLPLETLLFDPKEFAFLTNTTFRGLTIAQKGIGWNIVLRAYLRDGSPVYALTEAEEPLEGLQRLLGVLATTSGVGLWHRDKYYQGNG